MVCVMWDTINLKSLINLLFLEFYLITKISIFISANLFLLYTLLFLVEEKERVLPPQ